jgi:hypothetical protein
MAWSHREARQLRQFAWSRLARHLPPPDNQFQSKIDSEIVEASGICLKWADQSGVIIAWRPFNQRNGRVPNECQIPVKIDKASVHDLRLTSLNRPCVSKYLPLAVLLSHSALMDGISKCTLFRNVCRSRNESAEAEMNSPLFISAFFQWYPIFNSQRQMKLMFIYPISSGELWNQSVWCTFVHLPSSGWT